MCERARVHASVRERDECSRSCNLFYFSNFLSLFRIQGDALNNLYLSGERLLLSVITTLNTCTHTHTHLKPHPFPCLLSKTSLCPACFWMISTHCVILEKKNTWFKCWGLSWFQQMCVISFTRCRRLILPSFTYDRGDNPVDEYCSVTQYSHSTSVVFS